MAGRLYRMAKVVSANPKSWGIVDANEISGFKRVAKLSDLYSIAECILSSSYGDGVTDGADAVGQIWHVSETNGDYKLTNWASRKSAAGWTKLSYGGDVSVPVKDVQVTKDGTTASVLSNGVAKIDLTPYAKTTTTNTLTNNVNSLQTEINNTNTTVGALSRKVTTLEANIKDIDTTVYEVIGNKPLPTTGIKKCIYLKLIETGDPTGDNNKYAEYVYTADPGATYDATNWEKLGEVAAKTDLSEYYKKTEIDSKVDTLNSSINNHSIDKFTADAHVAARPDDEHKDQYKLYISLINGDNKTAYIKPVTNTESGVMTGAQKVKLDGIEAKANNYTHPSHTAAATTKEDAGLYKVIVDDLGHVTKTTAVDKNDITALGIPGSAPTVDAAMSETSTNAVQNKVIDSAIKTHKVNNSNFKDSNDVAYSGNSLLFYSQISDGITYHDIHNASYRIVKTTDGIPKIAYSANGSTNNSYLLRDIDMVALTDTELNEILK